MTKARSRSSNQDSSSDTRILIVDDHALVREGLAEMIHSVAGMSVCGQAGSIADARRLIEAERPDLVIIDLTLIDGSGLALVEHLREHQPEVASLVISVHDDMIYAENALRAGARGYLCKSADSARILDAIRTVLSEKIYLDPAQKQRMVTRLTQSPGSAEWSPRDLLSDRELEVLTLIGLGYASREIAEHLGISPKTIDSHRDHIKEKLDLPDSHALVHYAVRWQLEQARIGDGRDGQAEERQVQAGGSANGDANGDEK